MRMNNPTKLSTARHADGLYDAVFPTPPVSKALFTKADQLEIILLHRRLGHAGKKSWDRR